VLALLFVASGAQARELASVTRIDAAKVSFTREDDAPISVWLSDDTRLDKGDRRLAKATRDKVLTVELPATRRAYLLFKGKGGTVHAAAERVLPLAQGSNFRDIGGYVTRDGRAVRWGRVYRSGAQPLLTAADDALVDQLHLGTVVDLRSIEERQINPDTIDDREGALFVSNDYPMASMMAGFQAHGGEDIYRGMERSLAPQYRSLYRRIMVSGPGHSGDGGEGAVLYHCSAGQDRTGVATALLYDMLGVDRETILADYHLSTQLRRPFWEMPRIDPAKYPGNMMAAYYAKAYKDESARAEPLYTKSGASHLGQFFTYLDATYGGSEGYMRQVLGFGDADLLKLRAAMLD
jgi:protein-tyrosine phosphatase